MQSGLQPLQHEPRINIIVVESAKQKIHAYSSVGVIKCGTYSRALLRGTHKSRGVKLKTPDFVSVCKNAKGPRKRQEAPSNGPPDAQLDHDYNEDGQGAGKCICPPIASNHGYLTRAG